MTKRVLIIHPNNDYNCGDLLTYLGTKWLILQALGGHSQVNFMQYDEKRALSQLDTYINEYDWGDIDVIALAGSPWLWGDCYITPKYKLVKDAVFRYPKAKFIGLGLGSNFAVKTLKEIYEKFWHDTGKMRFELAGLFSAFDYIFTRDSLALSIFDECKIKASYKYDTSVFSHRIIGKPKDADKKEGSVLFFYDPMKSNMADLNEDECRMIVDIQIKWAKTNNAKIYINTTGDKDTLNKLNIEGDFTTDIYHLIQALNSYKQMMSGRVHMAILGFIAGIPDITLIATDTRFMTALKFGIKIQFSSEENAIEYEPQKVADNLWQDIDKEEQVIINELKEALK